MCKEKLILRGYNKIVERWWSLVIDNVTLFINISFTTPSHNKFNI